MVDFKKRLSGKTAERPTDPVKLYDTLDRAHDKGPLRPAQAAVLKDWFASHRDQKVVIVKLYTGQGKTLIGLLMLQAQLNNGNRQSPSDQTRADLRLALNRRQLGQQNACSA